MTLRRAGCRRLIPAADELCRAPNDILEASQTPLQQSLRPLPLRTCCVGAWRHARWRLVRRQLAEGGGGRGARDTEALKAELVDLMGMMALQTATLKGTESALLHQKERTSTTRRRLEHTSTLSRDGWVSRCRSARSAQELQREVAPTRTPTPLRESCAPKSLAWSRPHVAGAAPLPGKEPHRPPQAHRATYTRSTPKG